jgi:hypothetical protein
MTEKIDEKELNALKVDIANLREKIAALTAGLKKLAQTKPAGSYAESDHEAREQGGSADDRHGESAWTDFQYTFGEARVQFDKVLKVLEGEIRRHPLVGGMAAFGLGFIIAKRWYRESK